MDIKDIQIEILTNTIAGLMRENAEIRSALIVMQNQKFTKDQEVTEDGEHQNSSADE